MTDCGRVSEHSSGSDVNASHWPQESAPLNAHYPVYLHHSFIDSICVRVVKDALPSVSRGVVFSPANSHSRHTLLSPSPSPSHLTSRRPFPLPQWWLVILHTVTYTATKPPRQPVDVPPDIIPLSASPRTFYIYCTRAQFPSCSGSCSLSPPSQITVYTYIYIHITFEWYRDTPWQRNRSFTIH